MDPKDHYNLTAFLIKRHNGHLTFRNLNNIKKFRPVSVLTHIHYHIKT